MDNDESGLSVKRHFMRQFEKIRQMRMMTPEESLAQQEIERSQLKTLSDAAKSPDNAAELALLLAQSMADGKLDLADHILCLQGVTALIESEYDTVVGESINEDGSKNQTTVQDIIISGIKAAIANGHTAVLRSFNNCTILSRNIMDDEVPALLMEASKPPLTYLTGNLDFRQLDLPPQPPSRQQ